MIAIAYVNAHWRGGCDVNVRQGCYICIRMLYIARRTRRRRCIQYKLTLCSPRCVSSATWKKNRISIFFLTSDERGRRANVSTVRGFSIHRVGTSRALSRPRLSPFHRSRSSRLFLTRSRLVCRLTGGAWFTVLRNNRLRPVTPTRLREVRAVAWESHFSCRLFKFPRWNLRRWFSSSKTDSKWIKSNF